MLVFIFMLMEMLTPCTVVLLGRCQVHAHSNEKTRINDITWGRWERSFAQWLGVELTSIQQMADTFWLFCMTQEHSAVSHYLYDRMIPNYTTLTQP